MTRGKIRRFPATPARAGFPCSISTRLALSTDTTPFCEGGNRKFTPVRRADSAGRDSLIRTTT
ncbi:MAG: hypothetical protein WKF74_06490 [Pyrinomonadaceae bacterium]